MSDAKELSDLKVHEAGLETRAEALNRSIRLSYPLTYVAYRFAEEQ